MKTNYVKSCFSFAAMFTNDTWSLELTCHILFASDIFYNKCNLPNIVTLWKKWHNWVIFFWLALALHWCWKIHLLIFTLQLEYSDHNVVRFTKLTINNEDLKSFRIRLEIKADVEACHEMCLINSPLTTWISGQRISRKRVLARFIVLLSASDPGVWLRK